MYVMCSECYREGEVVNQLIKLNAVVCLPCKVSKGKYYNARAIGTGWYVNDNKIR